MIPNSTTQTSRLCGNQAFASIQRDNREHPAGGHDGDHDNKNNTDIKNDKNNKNNDNNDNDDNHKNDSLDRTAPPLPLGNIDAPIQLRPGIGWYAVVRGELGLA
ncbi:hypothetical protein F5Y17DRAFT_462677 [Xylariaceae sp. FL0594]|nr:hypothetical protein F5Y17DRAFT_462677 [Xylariaceae sp. FL0594]